MKTSPPPPRSSAIGPLGTTSYTERSVTCVHCQKAHDRGFIWNFSDTLRVCFTCYRTMGEDGRKSYERKAAKEKSTTAEPQPSAPQSTAPPAEELLPKDSKGTGYTVIKVMGLLTLLFLILGAGVCYLYRPLTGEIAEHRVQIGESRIRATR